MSETWGQRRARLEMAVESVLIELMREKTDKGMAIRVNPSAVIAAFNELVNGIESAKAAEGCVISVGHKDNEE